MAIHTNDTSSPSKQDPTPSKPARLSRRSLLRAGAAASPVLVTLAAGPVAAQGINQCVVASSFVSVATFKSRNPNATNISCSSQNADFWREQASVVPTPGALTPTVEAFFGRTSSSFNLMSLKDVMLAPLPTSGGVRTAGEIGVLQHLIAMALNLTANVAAPGNVNLPYLQGIWANYKMNGDRYILTASSINWSDTELIAWLRYLMYPISLP